LPDAAGAPVRVWRSGDTSGLANENITLQVVDVLRRPTVAAATLGAASPRLVERPTTTEGSGASTTGRLAVGRGSLTAYES
jgi:hypothetical protein